jgi:hypothetical protein
MKISFIYRISIIVIAIVLIATGVLSIQQVRVCKEYNKNIYGQESIRSGCKTWA